MTKRQIEDFIAACYDADEKYANPENSLAHLAERLRELKAFVQTLDDKKYDALAASEL